MTGHVQVRGHQVSDERAAAGDDVHRRDGPMAGRGTKGRDAQRGQAQGRLAPRTAAGAATGSGSLLIMCTLYIFVPKGDSLANLAYLLS